MLENQMTEFEKKNWSDQKPRKYGSMTQEEYIEERLNQFRAWYDKKASRAKKVYQWMRTITVAGGAIVPVLININCHARFLLLTCYDFGEALFSAGARNAANCVRLEQCRLLLVVSS